MMSICMMTASGYRHFLGISALLQCNPKTVKRFSEKMRDKTTNDTKGQRAFAEGQMQATGSS